MIYVFPSATGECSVVCDETTLTDENKANGIFLEELPVCTPPTDKTGVLMGNKETGQVWWEYVEIVPSDVEILKNDMNDANNLLLEIDFRVMLNENGLSGLEPVQS